MISSGEVPPEEDFEAYKASQPVLTAVASSPATPSASDDVGAKEGGANCSSEAPATQTTVISSSVRPIKFDPLRKMSQLQVWKSVSLEGGGDCRTVTIKLP